MIDYDLAALYGVPTKALNQAVRRNPGRFPQDFVFRLTAAERDEVVTNCDHLARLRFSPVLPVAFTENAVAMLSSVLNSPRAILVNVEIIRTFTRLRKTLVSVAELRRQLDALERIVGHHDERFAAVFASIRQLAHSGRVRRRRIGFQT